MTNSEVEKIIASMIMKMAPEIAVGLDAELENIYKLNPNAEYVGTLELIVYEMRLFKWGSCIHSEYIFIPNNMQNINRHLVYRTKIIVNKDWHECVFVRMTGNKGPSTYSIYKEDLENNNKWKPINSSAKRHTKEKNNEN